MIYTKDNPKEKDIKAMLKNYAKVLLVFIITLSSFSYPDTDISQTGSCRPMSEQKHSDLDNFLDINCCSQESKCDYCEIHKCCETNANHANNSKHPNSNSTNLKFNRYITYLRNHPTLPFLQINEVNSTFIWNTRQNECHLPKFATNHLLTVTLLC